MIHIPGRGTSRRGVLGIAAAGAAGLVFGPSVAQAGAPSGGAPSGGDAVAEANHGDPATFGKGGGFSTDAACGSTVVSHSEILDQPTYYEVSRAPASFNYNATLYSRLETWLTFFFAHTPVDWTRPGQVWTYGCYVDRNDGCTSYHNYGRAFDLSGIYATDPHNGVQRQVFSARYDQWRSLTGAALIDIRKRYWATAASCNYHFKYVLTYFYNSDHYNHIHVDNSVSGSGNSTFTTGTSSQVQCVQAQITYVWEDPIDIDGIWGPQTSGAVSRVLARIGRSGSLTTQANWLEFNKATLRFGSGTQTY